MYQRKGDLDLAKDYYQRAPEIQGKQLVPNHVDVASSYNNICNVYQRKGDLNQAKDYHQRAIEIKEKQLGPNHVDVASSYNNIGNVYQHFVSTKNISRWLWKYNFYFLVLKTIFYSLAALVRKILFSPLENKSHISAPP